MAGAGGELRQQIVVLHRARPVPYGVEREQFGAQAGTAGVVRQCDRDVVGAGGQQQPGVLGVDGHRLAVVDAHPQRFDDPAQTQRRRGGEWTVRE
ncbi:hypothetical protein WKI71_04070 [Streptomyces sp. MS1.AVA.1]|uniref:Uncharacterized protein n=1 Tax=Streptomyces machairae TaxID=3134109 RepID=A0ABU8UGM8_9ACTN